MLSYKKADISRASPGRLQLPRGSFARVRARVRMLVRAARLVRRLRATRQAAVAWQSMANFGHVSVVVAVRGHYLQADGRRAEWLVGWPASVAGLGRVVRRGVVSMVRSLRVW